MMEFEFIKNSLTGEYLIKCEMGHEVLARWLHEEVGADAQKILEVQQLIEQSLAHPTQEIRKVGPEISLVFHNFEVQVYENSTRYDAIDDSGEDFALYDSESTSESGIEDFSSMLQQWDDFIHNR
jgi:uncharacterized protein YacL (UPF0231 family)